MRNFLRQPITIFTGVAVAAAITAIYYAGQRPDYNGITLISNIAVFLASGLISYLITYNNEREQFSKNMRQLADFAKRRVELLRDNLASLTEVIRLDQEATAQEIKKFVSYTLTNLSEDAEASVYDIEGMGRIDHGVQATEVSTDRKPSSQTALQAPPERALEETVSYNCPACGYSNDASLGSSLGTTKVVTCSNCQARANLHRVNEGRFKVVSHARLASYTRPTRSSTPPPVISLSRQMRDINFECPRCHNAINVKTSDSSPINRICFRCLASLRLDPSSNIASITNKDPIYTANIHLSEMTCPNCQNFFTPQIHTTKAGREFIICHECNTVYLSREDEKQTRFRPCPGCGQDIRFRIHPGELDTKQFCYDCKKRLALNLEGDEVSVVETLTVPKISMSEFSLSGRKCPHCGNVASSGYTTNAQGERLSVCWSCKNVFEIVPVAVTA